MDRFESAPGAVNRVTAYRYVNDVLNLIPLAESLSLVAAGKIAVLGARGGMMTCIAGLGWSIDPQVQHPLHPQPLFVLRVIPQAASGNDRAGWLATIIEGHSGRRHAGPE